jgi:hypothetical protein
MRSPSLLKLNSAEQSLHFTSIYFAMASESKSGSDFPVSGLTNDGWSNDKEATVSCFCGDVQMVVVCASPHSHPYPNSLPLLSSFSSHSLRTQLISSPLHPPDWSTPSYATAPTVVKSVHPCSQQTSPPSTPTPASSAEKKISRHSVNHRQSPLATK